MMWRSMNTHPTNRPFGVMTTSGRARTARVRNNRIIYDGPWTDHYKRACAHKDPPAFWWHGQLPVLPKDIERQLQRVASIANGSNR